MVISQIRGRIFTKNIPFHHRIQIIEQPAFLTAGAGIKAAGIIGHMRFLHLHQMVPFCGRPFFQAFSSHFVLFIRPGPLVFPSVKPLRLSPAAFYRCRQRTGKNNREALRSRIKKPFCQFLRDICAFRDHQRLKFFLPHHHFSAADSAGFQKAQGDYFIIQLVFRQQPAGLLKGLISSQPLHFRGVKQCDAGRMPSSVKQVAHPVHIPAKAGKPGILGIISPCVKMWRAVRIREISPCKCVWDEPVDPSYEHVIRQPLHQLQPFTPAIGAINLAHGSSLFLRIQMAQRSPHFCKAIVKEGTVIYPFSADIVKFIPIIAGADLLQHHINSGHMLSPQRFEKMSGSQAKPGVSAAVLNYMADIFHIMSITPFSNLAAEIQALNSS